MATGVVPGLDWEGEWWHLVLIGLVFGLVNTIVKPILTLFSLPAVVLTLGLFLLVINWLMFTLVVALSAPERLDLGLTSTDGWATFFGSLVVSVVTWGLTAMFPPAKA